jgi:hypothetical protein
VGISWVVRLSRSKRRSEIPFGRATTTIHVPIEKWSIPPASTGTRPSDGEINLHMEFDRGEVVHASVSGGTEDAVKDGEPVGGGPKVPSD